MRVAVEKMPPPRAHALVFPWLWSTPARTDLPSAKGTDGLASRKRCGVGQSTRAGRETAGGGRGCHEASGAGREESGRHDDVSVGGRGRIGTLCVQEREIWDAWSGSGTEEWKLVVAVVVVVQ